MRPFLHKLLKQKCRAPGKWMDDIRKVTQKLEIIEEQRYLGALVRTRAENTAAREAPSKRALGLEKAQAERYHVDRLEWGDHLSTDNDHFQAAFHTHYQALFALQAVDVTTFKEFIGVKPQLDDEKKQALELEITETEVQVAIDALNPGKLPGTDGFTAAFYKAYKHKLLRSYEHSSIKHTT